MKQKKIRNETGNNSSDKSDTSPEEITAYIGDIANIVNSEKANETSNSPENNSSDESDTY